MKKIRYSELTPPPAQPLSRFTPRSVPAVDAPVPSEPAAPPSAEATPARVRRNSAPVDLARALARARVTEAANAAETLAHVEARAAAAHARMLASSEASALAAKPEPESVRAPAPSPRTTLAMDQFESYDDFELDEPRAPLRPLRERARNREGVAELLMFCIGKERFAVELLSVEEAIDLPEVHHVPEMPPAMLGVITVRGVLTPVFTPDLALGVPVRGRGAALIFRANRGRFALAIDDVDDVMTLDLALLRDAPGSEVADSVVLGVARNEGVIVALVDADALVLACQSIPVLELA